jgi:hypothetical protein
MVIAIAAPLLVALVGGLLYRVAANPKDAELGRIAFAAGMLWLVYECSKVAIRL